MRSQFSQHTPLKRLLRGLFSPLLKFTENTFRLRRKKGSGRQLAADLFFKKLKNRRHRVSGFQNMFVWNQTQPCAFIASATFRKPAMFAPATRSSPRP